MKLYEIPQEFQHLEDLLIESGGELTPEIEAAFAAIQEQCEAKIEAAACVAKNLAASAEAAKAEANRLFGRAQAFENAEARLRTLILPALQALGGKVKTARFTIYTTTRESVAFALKPGHEAFELPEKFIRVREPELNKTALKDALKAGEEIPDFLNVETTTNTTLTIR